MKFIEINSVEFEELQKKSNPYLIDVREEYEFEEFNLGGKNIPMSEILSRTDEFADQLEIILCCASGKRSKTVAYHLAQQLENTTIYSLSGGVNPFHK